jgi:HlyD family secretion protein
MRTQKAIRHHLLAGVGLVTLLVVGVGGWALLTDISGAVISPGILVVASRVQEVQHPTGGIVAEICAHDGDHVKAGDVLVRLDATVTRANLAIITKTLNELMTRKARLIAERDGADSIVFPQELLRQESDPDVAQNIASERRLFDIRRAAHFGQKQQLAERIKQLRQEGEGYTAQVNAKAQEILFINRELEGARTLWKQNLMPISKLTEIERGATRIEGERGQFVATLAQSNGKIAETELQILQVDRDLGSEDGKELRDIDAKLGEFVERKITAEDQLKRIDIRAPQDGTVHESAVHTVGGVIAPGNPIMVVVPNADSLIIEAKVPPQDIDQLQLGQAAGLRFSAFNQRTTPEINGTISRIGADVTVEQRTGQNYYTVDIATRPEEVARLGDVKLIPGMPVETFIKTGDRKVISYLIKPLRDQIVRAFREQ